MKLHTFLYDLNDVLPGLGFDGLRIDDAQTFKAVGVDKNIVLFGKTKELIEQLEGTCGLGLVTLGSMLNAPGFSRLTMTSSVGTSAYGDFIELNSGTQQYQLPLWSEAATRENVRVPPFKGAVFNISATPTADGAQLLKYWRGKLRQDDEKGLHKPLFALDMDNGKLMAENKFGNERVSFAVSNFCVGTPSAKRFEYGYSSAMLIKLCELHAHTVNTLLQVSEQGAVSFEVETTHCHYHFVLPGSKV